MRLLKDALKSLFSHKKRASFVALSLFVFNLSFNLSAAQYRWTGATDSTWEELTNWEIYDDSLADPDWVTATALPGASDDVSLVGASAGTVVSISSVQSVNSISVSGTYVTGLSIESTGDFTIPTAFSNPLPITVEGTLSVSGNLTAASEITVNGILSVTGDLTASSDITVDGDLSVTGDATVSSDMTVDGTLSVGGDLIANSDITVEGTVTVTGNLTAASTIIVKNAASVTVSSDITVSDTVTVMTGGSLSSTGDISITSTGTISSDGTVSAGVDLVSDGLLSSGGTVTVGQDLEIQDDGVVINSGSMTVTEDIANDGNCVNNVTLSIGGNISNAAGSTLTNSGTLHTDGNFTNASTATLANDGTVTVDGYVSNAGGTIENDGTLSVNGNLSNTGGTLTNSDTINVKGNLSDTGTYTGTGDIVLNGTSQTFTPKSGTAYSKVTVSSATALTVSGDVEIKNFIHNSGNITFTGVATITDSIGGTENTGTLTFNDTLTTGCASSFKNTGLTTLSGAATFGGNASFPGDVKASGNITGSGTLSFQNISVTDSVVISGTQVSVASGKTITTTTAGKNLTLKASGGTISVGQIGTTSTKFNTVELDTGSSALSFTSEDVHASSIKLTSTGNVSVTGIDYDGELIFNTSAKVSLNGGTDGLSAVKLTYSTTPSSYEVSGDIEITGTSGIVFDKAVVLKGDTLLKTSGTNAPVTIENGISGSYALEINNKGLLTIDDKTSLTDTGTADVSVSSFKQSGAGNVSIAGDITAASTIDFSATAISLTGDVLLNGTTTKFSSAVTLGTSGSYELTVNGTLNNAAAVTADINVNAMGNVTSDGNWAGTKSLIFNGTGNQTFTVSSDSTYKDVKIEKSSGNLTTAGSGKATVTALEIDSAASSVITFNNETALANINLTKANKTIFNKDTTISAASIDSTNSGDIEFNGGGKVLVSVIEAGGTVKVTGSSKLSFPNGLTAKSLFNVTGVLESTDLEIDGSTFANSGTLSVGGDLTSSGTLTNGGTGTLAVTGDITSSGVFTNNGTTTAGSDFTNTSGGTLTNGGDLTITGNLSNSGSSSISNSGDIVLNGNLTNDLGSSIANSDTISLKGNFTDSGTYTGNGTVIFNGTTQSFTPNASTTYAKITSSSSAKLTVQDNANIKTFTHNSGNLEFKKPLTVTTSYTGSTNTGTVIFDDTVTTTCAATFSNTGLTTFTYPATFGGNVSFAGDVQLSGNLTSSGTVSFQNLTVTDSVEISGTQITAASGKKITTTAASGTKNLTLKSSGGTITAGQIGTSTYKFNIVELDTGSHDINFTSETIYANQIKFTSSGNVTVTGITYNGDLIFNTSGKVSINGGTNGFKVKNIVLQTTPLSFELSGNIEITGTGGISFPKAVVLTGNTVLTASGTNAPVTFSSGISGAYSLDVYNAGLLTIDDKTSLTDTANADINIASFNQRGAGAVSIAGDITCSTSIQFVTTSFTLTGNVLLSGNVVALTSAITLSSSSSYELSVSGKLQAYNAVTANVNVNALNDVVSNGNWAGSKSLIFAGSNNQIFNPKTGTSYSSVYIIKTGGTFTCSRANAEDSGTTAVTFTNININSASPTITFGFDKGLNITGTIDIDDSKAVVFNNTVTIATMTADKSDSLTFNGPTTITTVSIDNNGSTAFNDTATIATISIDNNGTTTFNDTAIITTFNVDKNTSTTFNGTTTITNISDTTDSGTFTFNDGVTFANNVTLNTTKLVTFKGTSNIGAAGARKNFTHTGGITNINGTFNANDVSLGAMTSTQELTINADDISVNGTTTTAAKFTVNATTLTMGETITTAGVVDLNCNTTLSGNITWTNSNYIKTATGKSINCTGNFTQGTGSGTNNKSFMLGGSFTASGSGSFSSNVFYYGNTTSSFGSTGTGSFTLAGNFLVGLNGSGATNVISNVSAKNYVCLAGTVNLSAGKFLSSTTGDVVIVGANAIFEDSTVTNSISEYDYTGSRGSSATSPSTPQYTMDTTFPDGTDGGMSSTGFAGKMTFGSGAVLHAGQNFYANGTTLTGSATWYIDIKKTSDSESAFAECYKTTVTNCTVRKHGGNAFTAGAESATDTQIMCDEGCITATNCKNFDNTVFEIVNAYTVRDNVIRVEFSHPVRNFNGELNKKPGTGSTVTSNLQLRQYVKYKANTGTDTAFAKIFTDEECTTELQGDIDSRFSYVDAGGKTLYYCYLKAPDASDNKYTWATDATGTSSGATDSTDRYGNTRNTAKPYIQVPRATATLKFVVTDIFGKRLTSYKSGSEFTAVQDKTAPALIAVRTGQENHADEATNQWSYDAHNFIEFRYSEEVDFNQTDNTAISALTAGNVNVTSPSSSVSQNILVNQYFGGISEDMSSDYNPGVSAEGITFIGLGHTAAGYICTGKDGTNTTPTANNVNALYRTDKFSVRISIAGYTNGTVTGGFRKWAGYIESAKIPSGAVTVQYTEETSGGIKINKCVKDQNGNYLKLYSSSDKTGTNSTTGNANLSLTVDNSNTAGAIYGGWDLSSPEFAKVHKVNQINPETYFEAVGMGTGTVLDRVEIHLTDNTGGDNFTDGSPIGNWITSFGWSTDHGASLANPNTYCADIFGGSRPYAGGTSYTKGGIRYCTILNQQTNFKYCVGTGAGMVPTTQFSNIQPGGTAPIFVGASATRRDVPTTKDNTYIQFYLASSDNNLAYDTTFTITYDAANSYITDLAGNRLRSISLSVTNMESIDRTQPTFDLVIAPVGSDEIYIQFVKQLTKQIIYQANTSVSAGYISHTFEEIIPYCFEIGKINPSTHAFETTGVTLQIDRASPATIIDSHSNTSFTAVRMKLNRAITLDDVEHLYIRVTSAKDYPGGVYAEKSVDPFTSIANSYVTFIQDSIGNYMQMYSAHCLSDFAVNVVFPTYAYDPDFVDENGDLIHDGLYTEGSYAVHDWGQNQGNYGTLKAKDPVILLADVTDGTAAGEAANLPDGGNNIPPQIKMYISSSPTPQSQSAQYNIDLSKSLRVWVPGTIPLYGLSGVTNANTDTLYGAWDTTEGGITFTIPQPLYSSWSSGNQITFLFGLENNAGTPLTIIHTPVLNVSSGTFTYTENNPAPLYALRLSNPDDITSIDLWSFRVKDETPQRGGITIMNNVIDPTVGEKMVLSVNMKSEGDLSIMVMTLDGNVITYLNRGTLSAGEYYFTWDGRNRKGNMVARGMYFIRIIGNGIDETRKVMVVKE